MSQRMPARGHLGGPSADVAMATSRLTPTSRSASTKPARCMTTTATPTTSASSLQLRFDADTAPLSTLGVGRPRLKHGEAFSVPLQTGFSAHLLLPSTRNTERWLMPSSAAILAFDSPPCAKLRRRGARSRARPAVINVAPTINIEGGSQGEEADGKLADDIAKRMEVMVRTTVGDELTKQMRPGNMIYSAAKNF
jgi:hypothetical protein